MESSLFLKNGEPTQAKISTPKSNPSKRGFTVLELLISLAIMGIIMAVAITGQSTYNKNILLTDTAYSVALSLRQAQSYGLSSKKAGTVQNAGFGIQFSDTSRLYYDLYADTSALKTPRAPSCPNATSGPEGKPGNCLYDTSVIKDILVQRYTFDRGYSVMRACGTDMSNKKYCTDTGGGNSLNPIDVVFIRPNNKVVMTGVRAGALYQLSCVEIVIGDPTSNSTKKVRVSLLGEVSVGQSCP